MQSTKNRFLGLIRNSFVDDIVISNRMMNVDIIMKTKISVVVIAKNEEKLIESCLKSVYGWADEILVLDSGSTDETVNISKKYATKVIETDWPGYSEQKERAVAYAKNEWILSIDADEVVSDGLAKEIGTLDLSGGKYSAYAVKELLYFYSRFIPAYGKRAPILLFNKSSAKFKKCKVHEKIEVVGKVGKLKGAIYHFSFQKNGMKSYFEKLNGYAYLSAVEKNNRSVRYPMFRLFASPFIVLFKYLFVQGAIFSGWRGVVYSLIQANYSFNKYLMLIELKKNDRSISL